MPQDPDNANFVLYNNLIEQGLYTKSYDEFQQQFSGKERIMKLFSAMKADGHYTKSANEFEKRFFSPLPGTKKNPIDPAEPKKVKIQDERQEEKATGVPLSDKFRFHAEVDTQHIQQVVATARKHGVNPYTALALNLAETRFDPEWKSNPFHMSNYDQYGDIIDESIQFFAEKQKYAQKIGKKDEADIIQAWNGYGTIKDRGYLYGIDTDTTPINMNEDPIYGKRIIDLRENVIKKNPEVTSIVDQVMASNPELDRQFYK